MKNNPYTKIECLQQAEALLEFGHCIFLGYDPCVMVIGVAPNVFSVSFIRDSKRVKHRYYTIDFFREAYALCVVSHEDVYSIKVPQDLIDEELRLWEENKA